MYALIATPISSLDVEVYSKGSYATINASQADTFRTIFDAEKARMTRFDIGGYMPWEIVKVEN